MPLPHILLFAFAVACAPAESPASESVTVGLGRYATRLAPGGEREPPSQVHRAAGFAGPVPTNQWYSSAMFSARPEPLYAQPASYRPTPAGMEVDRPQREVQPNSSREENDIAFPHRAALVVQPLGFEIETIEVRRASDFAVGLSMGRGERRLEATIAHGSPFSYYTLTEGDVAFRCAEGCGARSSTADARALAVRALGRWFGLYGPTGSRWERAGDDRWVLRLPPDRRYFSVAALPDDDGRSLEDFARHAYAFIRDSRVRWTYDEALGTLTTTFSVTTDVKEGADHGTLLGLYPHHWHDNPLCPPLTPHGYDTVRGRIKLTSGTSFRTRYTHLGFVPHLPALPAGKPERTLRRFIERDVEFGAEDLLNRRRPGGTYWEGKGLNKAAQVMAIAEQQGDRPTRDAILRALQTRMQAWFAPREGDSRYFFHHRGLGTLIGYPDEYGSAEQLNDHHFHYGYWIFAAAQVALRDPQWAARERWGGMVELLIGDIATTQRDHPLFPRLRVFDLYEGHSWASGTAPFFDGNNQESSSEAVNAWAGLILWGEATGNRQLRDTGIALYNTEIRALNHYWFDLHKLVFDPEYDAVDASLVWGSKYTHGTWFTDNPRMVHGINLLPITPASTYLGQDPAYVRRNLGAMEQEFRRFLARDGKSAPDVWQDILLSYGALADPQDALARWDAEGPVEDGDSRSRTWHWLHSLARLGRPDFTLRADAPLHAVFRRPDGTRTYLAYNAGAKARTVRFSNGRTLRVAPRSLGVLEDGGAPTPQGDRR